MTDHDEELLVELGMYLRQMQRLVCYPGARRRIAALSNFTLVAVDERGSFRLNVYPEFFALPIMEALWRKERCS